jgi:hypothetical protein
MTSGTMLSFPSGRRIWTYACFSRPNLPPPHWLQVVSLYVLTGCDFVSFFYKLPQAKIFEKAGGGELKKESAHASALTSNRTSVFALT